MQLRTLGNTGLEVSEIGYGAWGIGGKMWLGGTDDESVRALHRALELGLNFIDTALVYGEGHSEKLVGQVVRDNPAAVFIATKVPPKNRCWPARPGVPIEDAFPADYIVKCTEESLRNLGVESIALQQLHVWSPEWLESEEWRRGFEELKRSGKAQAVGVSINDHEPDSALDLIRTGLIDSVQVIYNIFDQTPGRQLLPLCQERGIGVIARVPFDEGSLSNAIQLDTEFEPGDFRARYFRGDRQREVVDHVGRLQHDLGNASLPEVALRFCLSSPAVSSVIPGMRRVKNVEANIAAAGKGPLDPSTLAALRRHAWDRNFYS